MQLLPRDRKEAIFRSAVRYGCLANSLNSSLHTLVGADLNQPIWWTQNDAVPVTAGVVGQFAWGDGLAIQVTTARCESDPATVSFVYAHEMAHLVLRHFKGETGNLLFGFYTRREAEADAFAYAFLYVTSQTRTPCGGRMPYNAVYQAMKKVHADDQGFYWSVNTRLADIQLVKTIWDQEKAADGGSPENTEGPGSR